MHRLFLKLLPMTLLYCPLLVSAKQNEPSNLIDKKLSDVCSKVLKADFGYFVVSPNGLITNNEIAPVHASDKNFKLDGDDVLIDTSFRLVINTQDAVLFNAPDLKFTKIKSTCPRNSEFKIFYAASTKSVRVGKVNKNLSIHIEKQVGEDRVENDVKFSADIISPKISWMESPKTESEATEFFQGKRNEFKLRFKNVGNSPMVIKEFSNKKNSNNWYVLDTKACQSQAIFPSESCDIVFTRSKQIAKTIESTETFEIQSNYLLGYPTLTIDWTSKKSSIEFSLY